MIMWEWRLGKFINSVWFGELFVSSDIVDLLSKSWLKRFLSNSVHVELGSAQYQLLEILHPFLLPISFPLRAVIISHGPFLL